MLGVGVWNSQKRAAAAAKLTSRWGLVGGGNIGNRAAICFF